MAFTYTGALDTDLDKLRFEIGDNVENAGVMPNGANIPDATMSAIITAEGSVGLAAARICESLARAWAKIAASIAIGSRSESNQQSANWTAQAAQLRKQYGERGTTSGLFSVGMQRDDAYHENNPNDTGVTSEYGSRTVYVQL